MGFKDVVREGPGKGYMLTNEAVVRAALEADVKVVSFYPGSPTVEILDTFNKASGMFDYQMEIATNEKLALETVAGASMVGFRSFTAMKSVGTNVASDALYSLAYTGLRGGCVMLLADDPHCHSSQSEQDGRWFGPTAYLPMLEPADPQEAMAMVRTAFEISERFGTLVLIRTTTRVNHQTGLVKFGQIKRKPFERINWKENQRSFVTVKAIARENKLKMLERMEALRKDPDLMAHNKVSFFNGEVLKVGSGAGKDCNLGIITAGVCYRYALEGLMKLGLKANILKIGSLNPLPEDMIGDFIRSLDKVIMVEELSPFLEDAVLRLAKDVNPSIEFVGKRSGHFSEAWEYTLPMVMKVLSDIGETPLPFDHEAHMKSMERMVEGLPTRVPVYCPGCPHRATYWSLRKAVKDKHDFFHSTDIGCYSMSLIPPIEWGDCMICMGASIGLATGAQFTVKEKVVALIGDSTLFHAGLPGVVNMVHNQDDILLIIMDNSVTAMTGQQTHPGNENTLIGKKGIKLDIETMLQGLGVETIFSIDSFKAKDNVKVFKKALAIKGPAVVVSHGECALYHFRNYRRAGGVMVPYVIDPEKCKRYYNCIKDFMCPAISINETDGKAKISPELCVGCGVCAQFCGAKAIRSTAMDLGGEDEPIVEVEDYRALVDKEVEN